MNQPPPDTDPAIKPDQALPAADEHTVQLARLEKLAQDHLDGWKRAKADYLNLKKQTDKDKQELALMIQAATVMEFMPIYDNLTRSLRHVPPEHQQTDWVKGITHIQKQLADTLKRMGIEPIPTVGQKFDHNLHHAVSKVKADDQHPAGTVVEEIKSGWRAGDRVLEPAQVVVAE